MNTTKKLLDIKNKIEKARSEKDQLEGRLKSEYERLEKQFSCKTLIQAKKIHTALKKEREEKQNDLENRLIELEENMENIEYD